MEEPAGVRPVPDSGGVFCSGFTGFLVFHTMTSEEQHVHVAFGSSGGFF